MTSQDRWRILSNITAQLGTDNVDLYAELAKAEGMINLMDTQKAMTPPPIPTPAPQQEPMTQPDNTITPM